MEDYMKKALVVLAVLCLTMALSCASSGGSSLSLPDQQRAAGPGEIGGRLGDFTTTNQPTQRGWCTNGTDGKEVDLTMDEILAAKFLVLQLSKKPVGGLQMIWQGDGNNWAWDQMDGVLSDAGGPNSSKGATLSDDLVLRIELSKALKNYNKVADCTQFKMYLGYYSTSVQSLGIITADLE
jgi:hypothetical protein